MSRNEDLYALALLCANQIVSDDEKAPSSFFPAVGLLGAQILKALQTDVARWSTFVHMSPSGKKAEKKKKMN